MDRTTRNVPKGKKGKDGMRLAARILGTLASLSLIATCIVLLANGQSEVASYPAIAAGVLGYLILRPGRRSVRISSGGVVVEVMSDDTGAFRTATDSVVSHITHEISERSIAFAKAPTIPRMQIPPEKG